MQKIFAVIAAFFALAISPQAVFAQNAAVRIVPSCGGPFDKCGFVRMEGFERKEEILPKDYEAALEFSEGLAGVRLKGKWGFINMQGEVLISPQFDLVGSFFNDLAEVLIDRKVGVINRQGTLVIKPQFARAIPFTKDVVLARPGDWRSGYFRGHEKLENIKTGYVLLGAYGLYSVKSGWMTEPDLEFSIFDPSGKKALIWAKSKDNKLYGLMRSDGSWQIEPIYDEVHTLGKGWAVVGEKLTLDPTERGRDEGLAVVKKGMQGLSGVVNSEGEIVVPLRPGPLSFLVNGFSITKDPKTQKPGLLDKSGNLVGGRYFDAVHPGENGLGEVEFDGRWHGIDQQGNIVAHPKDNEVLKECPSGLKVVHLPPKVQFMDKNNQPTSPYFFDSLGMAAFDCDRINYVRYNGKYGYVDQNGRLLVDPPDFENIFDFRDGYAPVMKNNKWGIINELGIFTVQPAYDELRYIGKGVFKAKLADGGLWINAEGIEQAPQEEEIDRTPYQVCPGGLKIIPNNAQGELWGLADENNNVIVKPQYRAIHCLRWSPLSTQKSAEIKL